MVRKKTSQTSNASGPPSPGCPAGLSMKWVSGWRKKLLSGGKCPKARGMGPREITLMPGRIGGEGIRPAPWPVAVVGSGDERFTAEGSP